MGRRQRTVAGSLDPGRLDRSVTAPARWYVLVDGEQTGPFELEAVRARVVAGDVAAETWVWADGMPEWRPAARVPALVPPPSLGVDGWTPARP